VPVIFSLSLRERERERERERDIKGYFRLWIGLD